MFRLNAGPGGVPLAGAGFLPMIDPVSVALSLPADSTIDRTLLGDRVTPIIQFLFQKAPWVM